MHHLDSSPIGPMSWFLSRTTVTAEVVHFACFVHVLNKNYDDTKKAEVHQPAQRPPLGRDTDSKTTAHRLYQVKLL